MLNAYFNVIQHQQESLEKFTDMFFNETRQRNTEPSLKKTELKRVVKVETDNAEGLQTISLRNHQRQLRRVTFEELNIQSWPNNWDVPDEFANSSESNDEDGGDMAEVSLPELNVLTEHIRNPDAIVPFTENSQDEDSDCDSNTNFDADDDNFEKSEIFLHINKNKLNKIRSKSQIEKCF